MKVKCVLFLGLIGATSSSAPGQGLVPDHERFLPIPFPSLDDYSFSASGPIGSAALHDPQSEQTEFFEIFEGIDSKALPSMMPSNNNDILGLTEENYIALDNFNSLVEVSRTTARQYPWSANVKLIMRFPGTTKFYVGTGALIDPMTVITAGHCVYSHDWGGWASQIQVIPAFDGTTDAFGDAFSKKMLAFTGWTQNRNLRYDSGVIFLDRPIGALAGWFGLSSNPGKSAFLNWTWNHASYPAEIVSQGNNLFYQYGYFDGYDQQVPDYVFYFRQAYGGESGSGFYYLDSNNGRYIGAILSNGSGQRTNAVYLEPAMFNSIVTEIQKARWDAADLTPLYVESPGRATIGSQIGSIKFHLHNYSKSNYSGTVQYSAYLSQDKVIRAGDQKIGDGSQQVNISPLGTLAVNFGPTLPKVPASIAGGEYYLGIILTSSDANLSNQATLEPDVAEISIEYPAPIATSISPSEKIIGESGFMLTVNGSDFYPASKIAIEGGERPTTFISSTRLSATILTSDISSVGEKKITVVNPAPGGGQSIALRLAVRPKTSGSGGGGCFIATLAYGDLSHPYVMILQRWRDECLIKNILGYKFIDFYYSIAPSVVSAVKDISIVRFILKVALFPVVYFVELWLDFGWALWALILIVWVRILVVCRRCQERYYKYLSV